VAVRRWRRSPLSAGTWRELGVWRHALRDRPYDVVLDTQGLIKSAVLARIASGRHCGFAAESAREPLAARLYDDGFVIPRNLHAVERNRWLAAAALDYVQDTPLDYGIGAQPLDADWLPPQPYAVLLTATSRADKLWPDAHWLAVCAGLHARGMAAVLPSGSEAERARARRLAENARRATAAPPLSIGQLAGLMAGAALVVGLDTGLTHLATALGVPVACIFSGSNPLLTGVLRETGAVNLGGPGTPPDPDAVLQAANMLLD
jgi:heptosyltransferase-1